MKRFSRSWSVGIFALGVGLGCGDNGEQGPAGADGADGADGPPSLLRLTPEPPGANCENGGFKVEHGLDLDGDGVLDDDEVLGEEFLCDGATGADGSDGSDGATSLVAVTTEDPGDNCADGGVRIDSGLDDSGDGVLDAGEIDATEFVCNGPQGDAGADGLASLVAVTAEDPGANCADGGVKIEHGIDDNDDGVLDASEVDGTEFVCNGADGTDGLDSLVRMTPEPAGTNCADGGVKIESGVDDSDDGVLDAGEVDDTEFVCNGADGADAVQTLFAVTTLNVGDPDCADGGALVEFGGDDSGDGTLDAGEVDGSFALCNGADGADGATSLIKTTDEPAGGGCGTEEGVKIEHGVDDNDDGVLDAGEVDGTAFVCDGADAPA